MSSSPARYRPRNAIIIDAIEWTGGNEDAVREFAGGHWDASMPPCYVARGAGHLFTVDADRFAATYEAAAPAGDDPADRLLALPLPPNDSGASTVRGYLAALLAELWREEQGFSGKRPFGSSGWQSDLYRPMVAAGIVDGTLDEDGWLESVNEDAADELILAAIERMGQRS